MSLTQPQHPVAQALLAYLEIYSAMGRHTGRTDAMLANAADGDWLIVIDSREARRVENVLRERGVQAERISVVSSLDHLYRCLERRRVEGRVLFDPVVLEALFREALTERVNSINGIAEKMTRAIEPRSQRPISMLPGDDIGRIAEYLRPRS